ncbi:hypothetical protein [Streptomyces sp. NPDC054829]
MGAANVKAVFARWGGLPHAPFRVLVYMALVSLDADDKDRGMKARQFYGGREALALAMGRMVPEEDRDNADVTRERHAAFAAVDRAVKVLTKEKAIKVLEAAGHYRPAKYELNLSLSSTTLSVDLQDHAQRGPKDHAERASSTTLSVTTDHAQRGLQEEQEPRGLRSGATGLAGLSPDPGAHASPSIPEPQAQQDPHVFVDDGEGRCSVCQFPRTNRRKHLRWGAV